MELYTPEPDPKQIGESQGDQIAKIYEPQSNCDPSCETCVGDGTVCTSCTSPSEAPIQLDNSCVASCPSGYFLKDQRCFKCHGNCASCWGYQDEQCTACNTNFYFENGGCVSQCSKNTQVVNGNCVSQPGNGACAAQCDTCSKDTNFCLSCKEPTPIANLKDGTCVANELRSCPKGFFVDEATKTCKVCSTACADCELSESSCFECHSFLSTNKLSWLDYTCVGECPPGTFSDDAKNECPICNPVCLTCDGRLPTNCLSCNRTS